MENTSTKINLNIQTRNLEDGSMVLDPEGEVDVFTAPRLTEALEAQIENSVRRLIINLARVEYMDSTGLTTLIKAQNRLQEVGGSLILVAPSPRIARLFELTQLNQKLTILANENEALTA